MLTVEEIEVASDCTQVLDFTRHSLELPELTMGETFYPMGFPVELRTNSAEILSQARDLWAVFEKQFDTRPIHVNVHLVDGDSDLCPPTPKFHMMLPLLINIADGDNYSIVDLSQYSTQVVLAHSTMKYRKYLEYFFLGSSPLSHIASSFATPVHAACVAFQGKGLLLCGDSGAGKSTLAYACARAGGTYITDDATYVLRGSQQRAVFGDCYQVRFRPTSAALFPEVSSLEITPRAAGKPSIEMPIATVPGLRCAQSANVDSIVFINRRAAGPPALTPYRKDVARHFMRQVLFGSRASLAAHYESLEHLLTADVFELTYSDFNWAVDRLQRLAREGQ